MDRLSRLILVSVIVAGSGCTRIGSEELSRPRPVPAEGGRPGPLGVDDRASQPPEGAGRPATTRVQPEPAAVVGADEAEMDPKIAELLAIPELSPVEEPPSRGGNNDEYEQSGATYEVLDSSQGYDERGIASWYGEPFHGRQTSSGEVYDMYALTAAHRSLPLPSFVEVTNLANGRKVILRVTDRGPFHEPDRRIIDVSYAAAIKLDLVGTGTAPVRVRALAPYQHR
jgi:rare lipoprotein A (peptidoglycan hydrolase)